MLQIPHTTLSLLTYVTDSVFLNKCYFMTTWHPSSYDCLTGSVIKVSASRAADLGLIPTFGVDLFQLHSSDLTRRANVQMNHGHHTYRTSSQSFPFHN